VHHDEGGELSEQADAAGAIRKDDDFVLELEKAALIKNGGYMIYAFS
jgi:hypothetical protein